MQRELDMRDIIDIEKPSRKQITFDLSQDALAKNYPRPQFSINPKFYKKAYKDISRFMKEEGFEHRQYSVYDSREKMTSFDITEMLERLAKRMPWLYPCVNDIDVTIIGKQHSVKEVLGGFTRGENDLYVKKGAEKQTKETGVSMSEWKAKVNSGNNANSFAKQADDRNMASEPREDIE
ncbi:MAG: hypothetical protein K2H41_00830 [Acetatifactor sp.]|nr:hypothetical protein [Acetatifactor sp.]MDE7113663.1 hypothetical protein [Acetatifactor sp.]